MAVTKTTCFVTSDGRIFDDDKEKEAYEHDALCCLKTMLSEGDESDCIDWHDCGPEEVANFIASRPEMFAEALMNIINIRNTK